MERHWRNVSINQGIARVVRQKLGEKHGIHSPSGPLKGNIHSHIDLDFCPWKLLNNIPKLLALLEEKPRYVGCVAGPSVEHERMGYHCGKGRKKFLRGLPLLKLFVRCWSVLPEFDF